MANPSHLRPAFGALERAWLRRAIARVEPIVWIEMAAIAALAAGFVFWQVHLSLASVAHDFGVGAAALRLARLLGLLALGAASLVGGRHAVRLRDASVSPWLSLPIPEPELGSHLAAMSRLQSLWILIPAAALIVSAAGVLPWTWMAALAAGYLIAHEAGGRLACAVALRVAAARLPRRAGLGPLGRVIVETARAGTKPRRRPARWTREPIVLAMWRNDLRLAWRVPATRRRAAVAAISVLLACVAWRLPIEPRLAHLAAFALSLIAAATVAEWLIATIGADPADVLRALPVGIGAAWGARVGWAALATLVLIGAQALVARRIEPAALGFLLTWIGVASLAIGTLGANYGVSLYPHTDQAQRVLALTLGLAMAASLMVPLMGWIVLLTAVVHSLRRVHRWARAEER